MKLKESSKTFMQVNHVSNYKNKSGSSGSSLDLGHINLKVHTAFLAYPLLCMMQMWLLFALGVSWMKNDKKIYTV